MNENEIYKKNIPDLFSNNEILKYLDEFIYLYKKRPIKNNIGGMRFPHMFSFYYLLKILKPEFIVESGVYKGQSTWLIENTLPKSKVLSIDLNLKQEFLDLNKQWDMGIDEKLILNEAKINVSPKLNIIWSKKNYIETVENERSIFRKYNYSLNYKNIINIE